MLVTYVCARYFCGGKPPQIIYLRMGKLLSMSNYEEKNWNDDGIIWYGNIVWEIAFFSLEECVRIQ